jgi:hypothetical protein
MKFLKFILVLLITVSMTNCSDDAGEPTITLSNDNIAGTYSIGKLDIEAKATTVTSGIKVTISNASTVGDTFQVDLTFTANGSYTASGQYRTVSTITPIGSSSITNEAIIVLDDSGTYQISNTNNTITFTSSTDNIFSGTFNVVTFNENIISLNQETEEVVGQITTDLETTISLIRE